MKITILTYGSRGDVQPFLALAVGLQKSGHQPRLVAPARFKEFVDGYEIPFTALAGDPGIISQRLNDAGSNPIRMVRAISGYVVSIAGQVFEQAIGACRDADLIVHSFLFTTGGHSFAHQFDVPDISVQIFPVFAPTHAFPPVYAPGLKSRLLRTTLHKLTTQVFFHGGNLSFRKLQKANPQKFNLKLRWPFAGDSAGMRTPLVFAFSPHVVPRPDEWEQSNIHIPGYFFLDAHKDYFPPDDLRAFLSNGTSPVCVTFGSMIHRDAERIYSAIISALQATRNRAIILSGWGDLRQISVSKEIFITESVPHDWLLPQCKAVIHHGGAGTTAAGLRAGIPNIVIPFAGDQPFWGERVRDIGSGPRPIPVKKLTADKLIVALTDADGVPLRTQSSSIGKTIQAEDGVVETIKLIEAFNTSKKTHYHDREANSPTLNEADRADRPGGKRRDLAELVRV